MKKNIGPVAIGLAAVALIGMLAVMYTFFFPPPQKPDTANPNGMPAYARNFLKNRKQKPATTPATGGTAPATGAPPGH